MTGNSQEDLTADHHTSPFPLYTEPPASSYATPSRGFRQRPGIGLAEEGSPCKRRARHNIF